MLNWADYIILGIIALSIIIGLFRGFFRESVALGAWILAFLAAIWFAEPLSVLLGQWIDRPGIALAVAYVVIFIGVLIAGAVVNYLIARLVKASEFAGTDKTLGAVFGLARGAVLVVGLVLLLTISDDPEKPFLPAESWWKESTLIAHVEPYSRWAHQWLPQDAAPYFVFEAPPQGAEAETQAGAVRQPAVPGPALPPPPKQGN